MQEFRGRRRGTASDLSFPYTLEKKERTIYVAALKNGEEENFFGPVVSAAPLDQLLMVSHLDPLPPSEAFLEIFLQGITNVPHRVKVYMNGVELEEVVFEGQSPGIVRLPVSNSLVFEGGNLVTLVGENGEMDVSVLDTIRLTYWHTYRADEDFLKLTAQGGQEVRVSGFSDSGIRVIDITDTGSAVEVLGRAESEGSEYSMTFRVPGNESRTLVAFTEDSVKGVSGIRANQPSSWYQEKKGADLVILANGLFLESLEPLKVLRESQGYSVALVDVEDIYDEFNGGVKSPLAIREFLLRARVEWKSPPRFVLLVGDASFDPRNYLGLGDFDFVPTKLIDTTYLETASDD
jgi:hypothetical protein